MSTTPTTGCCCEFYHLGRKEQCVCEVHKCPMSHQEKAGWEKKQGGKIHAVLNETIYRKLTLAEYKKVTKLIGEVFDREHSALQRGRDACLDEMFKIENEKWEDAEHCTCLGYAIIELAGGEESAKGQEWEKKLLEAARQGREQDWWLDEKRVKKVTDEMDAVSKMPRPWEDCICQNVSGDNEDCVVHKAARQGRKGV